MLKKFSKFLSLLLIVLTISSISICYATEAVTTSETEETANTVAATEEAKSETTTEEDTNYYGDLYLFDNEVVIDKVIYGNVYVIANKVKITGQIEGNLFVLAMDLTLDKSYVGGSIFACANNIYYNAASTYLYATANNIEMTYDSYVVRDAKIKASNSAIKAAVGRDLDLISSNINFGEGENIPIIYGDLRYTTGSELQIPEGVITETGSSTYTSSYSVIDILISFLTIIITTLGLCIVISKLTPNFNEKLISTNLSVIDLLKSFVIGLVTVIAALLVIALLILTLVGVNLALILALVFTTLCLISVPCLIIIITNKLKPALKIEKNTMFYIILSLVSIILYGITLIPFAGIFIGLIIKTTSIGFLVNMHLPHKELTDEEKSIKEEAKKQAKEDKEKRKQEKLEAKAAKKLEKETKKNENNL